MADKINAAGYETKPWWPYVRELMEGGGSVTVEQLNVTENGTYTAEAGKAYSPVVVNVPSGESDFSTAEVTVTMPTSDTLFSGKEENVISPIDGMAISTSPLGELLVTNIGSAGDTPQTWEVVLFNGFAGFTLNVDDPTAYQVTTTGSVTYDEGYLSITGSGSVTVERK